MNPFGPYRPDQPATVPGVSRHILGVIPKQDAEIGVAYRPAQSFNTALGAAALGSAPRGAISLIKTDGSYVAFVGTATAVRQLQSDFTWSDIDTSLTIASDDDRSFVGYGTNLVYSDTAEGMRAYDYNSGGSPAAVTDGPDARQLLVCNEILIALDCDGNNLRWANAEPGNHTNWSSRGANGDSFEQGGALIVGGDIGNGLAIVCQEAATRLFRVGLSTVSLVSPLLISEGIGSVGERSFTTYGGRAFWLDRRGFQMSNGGEPIPIGSGKVDRTFLSMVSASDLPEVRVAVDPGNEMVWWYFDGTLFGYNWTVGEWSTAEAELQAFFRMATSGYTLNSAGSLGTLNSLSAYPLNSKFWQGGAPSLAGIDTDGKVGFFDGQNMPAELDTALYNAPKSDIIYAATPETDDPNATLSVGTTDIQSSVVTYGDDVSKNDAGWCPVDGRGKNIVFREKHATGASWEYARGVDFINDTRA